jgi:hypothetical protein
MTRRNPTFWGFFSRFGGTTIYFAATGATYAFVKNFSANIRETDDSWNAAYGGFLAGSIQGLRRTSLTLRPLPAQFKTAQQPGSDVILTNG